MRASTITGHRASTAICLGVRNGESPGRLQRKPSQPKSTRIRLGTLPDGTGRKGGSIRGNPTFRSRCLIVLSALALVQSAAHAQRTSIAPFAGTHSEGWETFVPYRQYGGPPYLYLPAGQAIMAGFATIGSDTANTLLVYRPGTSSSFRIGDSGVPPYGEAQVAEGSQALGVSSSTSTTFIDFATPVTDFGAYWGAPTRGSPASFQVTFFDSLGSSTGTEEFTYDRSAFADGLLEWHGWHSTVPVARVAFQSYSSVIDGLQAEPVPEPGTLVLLTLGGLSTILRRRR
jgi:PEP-CTERM motif-containing protein